MRQAFAHEAVVLLDGAEADPRSLGAAITLGLCGSWEHEPPCPLASHHTGFDQSGREVRLRILFAAEPGDEATVRQRIEATLRTSHLVGPEGRPTHWRMQQAGPSQVHPDEAAHAQRLIQT